MTRCHVLLLHVRVLCLLWMLPRCIIVVFTDSSGFSMAIQSFFSKYFSLIYSCHERFHLWKANCSMMQGVEAQTLANVYLAMENNLEIIPVRVTFIFEGPVSTNPVTSGYYSSGESYSTSIFRFSFSSWINALQIRSIISGNMWYLLVILEPPLLRSQNWLISITLLVQASSQELWCPSLSGHHIYVCIGSAMFTRHCTVNWKFMKGELEMQVPTYSLLHYEQLLVLVKDIEIEHPCCWGLWLSS